MKQEDRWDYLSEKALEQLMQEVECSQMRKAPDYLKTMILDKVSETSVPMLEKTVYRAGRKKEFVLYCSKIVFAAAAAIALLITLPTEDIMQQVQTIKYEKTTAPMNYDEESAISKINSAANAMCGLIYEKSNEIFKEDYK